MHPTQTKDQARQLYFQSNLTRAQIAEITGISPRTLFDWIKEGDWLRARANAASAPALIAESYYNQLTVLNKKIAARHDEAYPTLEESTIIRRLAGTLKTVKPQRNRNEAVELLAEFSRFVRRHNAAAADVLTDIMTAFLETINTTMPTRTEEALRIKEYDEYLQSVRREEIERRRSEEYAERRSVQDERRLHESETRIAKEEARHAEALAQKQQQEQKQEREQQQEQRPVPTRRKEDEEVIIIPEDTTPQTPATAEAPAPPHEPAPANTAPVRLYDSPTRGADYRHPHTDTRFLRQLDAAKNHSEIYRQTEELLRRRQHDLNQRQQWSDMQREAAGLGGGTAA